jgi:general stress protein YciG
VVSESDSFPVLMPQTRSHQGNFTMDLQSLTERVDMLVRAMHTRDEHIQAFNRLQDGRFTQLMAMMEKLHTSVADKGPNGGQSSGTSAGSDVDFIHDNGEDGGTDHLHDSTASHKIFLPKIDLPVFDGTKPSGLKIVVSILNIIKHLKSIKSKYQQRIFLEM